MISLLSDSDLDRIGTKVTSDLSKGDYRKALSRLEKVGRIFPDGFGVPGQLLKLVDDTYKAVEREMTDKSRQDLRNGSYEVVLNRLKLFEHIEFVRRRMPEWAIQLRHNTLDTARDRIYKQSLQHLKQGRRQSAQNLMKPLDEYLVPEAITGYTIGSARMRKGSDTPKWIKELRSAIEKYPSTEDLITTVVDQLGITDNQQREKISTSLVSLVKQYRDSGSNGNLVTLDSLGRVAKAVAKIGDVVYKVKGPSDYRTEFSVFSARQGLIDEFKPKLCLDEMIVNDEVGIIAVQNVDYLPSKFKDTREWRGLNEIVYGNEDMPSERHAIAKELRETSAYMPTKDNNGKTVTLGEDVRNQGAIDVYEFIDHFMLVAGLFHASRTDGLVLKPARHRPSTGDNYIEVIENIPSNDFRKLFSRYGNGLVNEKGLLQEASEVVEALAYCLTIGDFKKNNTYRGYVIDFDRARLGHHNEDNTKWLDQGDFGLSQRAKDHFIKRYIMHRLSHDHGFLEQGMKEAKLYNFQRFYEALRVLSGKCCWGQNLGEEYYSNRLIYGCRNAKESRDLLRN